ncbi:13332_t:CDS:2 [Funneliformis caledonium]|uniref:13332_t:CDS:1 n=1 Tax=Funneliformis caledonium TaxID=1117310 RepID=A0A9N8VF03_9GLOM|nr:13332_t:CDS:2 [Funneliformis caledonium]
MDRNLLSNSDLSADNNLDEEFVTNDDDDEFWADGDDDENDKSCDNDDDWRLPNLSEHERNGLFDTFSRSREFGIDEYNSLLDVLTHPKEGLNLSKYDELGLY